MPGIAHLSSGSDSRKEASAQIAMIPFDLAYHIGQVFLPRGGKAGNSGTLGRIRS